jgi:hypothetical protein
MLAVLKAGATSLFLDPLASSDSRQETFSATVSGDKQFGGAKTGDASSQTAIAPASTITGVRV